MKRLAIAATGMLTLIPAEVSAAELPSYEALCPYPTPRQRVAFRTWPPGFRQRVSVGPETGETSLPRVHHLGCRRFGSVKKPMLFRAARSGTSRRTAL